MGGDDQSLSSPIADVDSYDPMTDSWRSVTPMMFRRKGSTCARVKNRLYVMGGNDGRAVLRSTEAFGGIDAAAASDLGVPDGRATGRVAARLIR